MNQINEITKEAGFKLQTLFAIEGKMKYWTKQGFVHVKHLDTKTYYIEGDSMERFLE